MYVIEVRDLKKQYKDFEAVKGISFEVEKNEIFGILGPNGAGKTTTLEIIECLKQQTSGTCRVLDFDNLTNSSEIKQKIGVQLQSSEYFDRLTLAELLQLFGGLYSQKIDPFELLNKVELREKAKNTFKELSGGQKQRFTIASALVHQPEILFLDEPTTGLDPHARQNMWQLVRNLREQGITVIMTTHYMEEAEYLCDRVAIMDEGKILQIDSPKNLIQNISKHYQMSFFVDKRIPENFFTEVAGISKVSSDFPKVVLEIENAEVAGSIIQKLKGQNISYSFLNLKTATLEDVYLQLTGREYESN